MSDRLLTKQERVRCAECGMVNYADDKTCGECGRPLNGPIVFTSNQISQWLRDYVAMMEANLGILQSSRIEGLYEGIVERVLEVRQYLKQSPSGERASLPQPLQQQTPEYYKLLQSYDTVVKENEKLRASGDSSAPETKSDDARDAERYRYLRERSMFDRYTVREYLTSQGYRHMHGDRLDRELDECIGLPPAQEPSKKPRLRDSDAAFNMGVLPTEQPEKASGDEVGNHCKRHPAARYVLKYGCPSCSDRLPAYSLPNWKGDEI